MKRLLPICALVLLQACSVMRSYPQVEAGQPLPAGPGVTRSLALEEVRTYIDHEVDVVRQASGYRCRLEKLLSADAYDPSIMEHYLVRSFGQQFRANHYNAIGGENSMFADRSVHSADLLVGAIIDHAGVDYCYSLSNLAIRSHIEGTAYVRIHWEVYDDLTKKTIYKGVSEGRYDITQVEESGWSTYLARAVDQAVRNLLADPVLARALDSGPQGLTQANPPAAATAAASLPENATDTETLLINAAHPAAGIDAPRAATVIIENSEGLGSGFLISSDGYILTNNHVVGDSHRVRVTLSDNRHLIGAVLRRDVLRDVALVKINGDGYPAAALRLPPALQVGDEVFAIGAPLGAENALTVTRGIVSAFRGNAGQPVIQSDVSTQHGNSGGPLTNHDGNVVAICVAGQMSLVNRSVGLNYFIPIDDAVNRLNIRMQ